ncbi:MAG: NUDIX domain-containing protein [Candidatus Odinarchaeota archaeon]
MKITKIKNLHSSNWLALKEASYIDKNGQDSTWQFVERIGNPLVVTLIVRSAKTGKILLIRQPRVPVDAVTIEFPAGLADEGETPENAALRELKEETGYTATIEKISPFLPKSAGLTNESAVLVFCSTDESKKGTTSEETTENIVTFWLHPDEFFDYIKSQKKVKVAIEVYAYFSGIQAARNNI